MSDVFKFAVDHVDDLCVALVALATAGAAVAKLTKTDADDKLFGKVLGFLRAFAPSGLVKKSAPRA